MAFSKEKSTGVLRSSLSATQIKKIIRSSMFVKDKFDSLGNLIKLKARLVAGGHMQDRSIYSSDQISSPTVATSSFFTIVAIAAAERRHVMTFDISQAYLNADMEGEVHMMLDPLCSRLLCEIDPSYRAFLDSKGCITVKLNKALYGCVESAKLWYNKLKSTLLALGYTVNPADICVFNRTSATGKQSTVCFHVDDVLATCQDEDDLFLLKEQIIKAFKNIQFNHGLKHEYLGMNLDFTTPGVCLVTMKDYVQKMLDENHIITTAKTPATANLFNIDENSERLDETSSADFHRITAQCLYLGTRVRPDILLATTFLCGRVQAPTMEDLGKLTRILCYLKHTNHLGLKIGGDEDGNIRLMCYADAAFAVHPAKMKSHTGIFISLGRGSVISKSNGQKHVASSSSEAELIALQSLTSLSAGQINFLAGQGIDIQAELFQDNTSTIRLAENGRSTSDRTRHIKIRYFFVKQYLDSGEMKITYCPTLEMIADILTKPLQGELFVRLRDKLLGY